MTLSMVLRPGARLGPYEILAPLGAGGMGEVYRARDAKLNRDVAIKILPDAFASDGDRVARFTREAQTLAALNHPHIAQIYGFEQSNDMRALVMELVEGEDLAQRIARGPMPIDETLAIATQIAEALEAAHEKGIVHRDLKPANIKLTSGGAVKILDFGLAKAGATSSAGGDDVANSPTFTLAATQMGVIIGTAAYMAPEQARGKAVDKRADIWAFGCVLYEMLAGRQPFTGDNITDIIAAVVKNDPDWSALPSTTPLHLRQVLRRCLEKDPKQRLRDIGEARILIEQPLDAAPAQSATRGRGERAAWAVAIALAICAVVALAVAWRATRPASLQPLVHLTADIGSGLELAAAPETIATGASGHLFAISPDGTRLALVIKRAGGATELATRLLRESAATPLAATEGAQSPFFSPDGKWIGFWAGGKLKKISVDGGAPVSLCDAILLRGASWGDDGYIVATLSGGSALVRIPAAGGTPEPLTDLRPTESTHRWPQVLPGSRAVLFTANDGTRDYDEASIDVVSLPNRERRTVHRGGFSARYIPSGHLVYARGSTIFAVPFDAVRLAVTGTAVPIVEDVAATPSTGSLFIVSDTGVFASLTGTNNMDGWPILWAEKSGLIRPLHDARGRYLALSLSPDGKRLAVTIPGTQSEDIWVKDLERGTTSRLTFLQGSNRTAVWTPDGNGLIFRSTDPNTPGLYWIRGDGSGEPLLLAAGALAPYPTSFSPDGKRLAVGQAASNGMADILTVPVENDGTRLRLGKGEVFIATPFDEWLPKFSPDGKWIAYHSSESGRFEIYVRPFPGPGGRWQISTDGGVEPRWSPAAQELLFQTIDGEIMAAPYSVQGDRFVPGQPRPWSHTGALNVTLTGGVQGWDLAPDGKQVVLLGVERKAEQKPVTQITLLLNFFDEVRRRLARGD